MFKVLNLSFSSDFLLHSQNNWSLLWEPFFDNFDIFNKLLAKVHVSKDFNQFTQKNLVESQNKYEHSKFDKDFMLFYYKKLNKITICKQIKENFRNCYSIIFQN